MVGCLPLAELTNNILKVRLGGVSYREISRKAEHDLRKHLVNTVDITEAILATPLCAFQGRSLGHDPIDEPTDRHGEPKRKRKRHTLKID